MVMCLRNMQPVAMGFPIARPRLYIIGVRKPSTCLRKGGIGLYKTFCIPYSKDLCP